MCTVGLPRASTTATLSRKLAAELTGAGSLQADLFLRTKEDGVFPGFIQTWRAEGAVGRGLVLSMPPGPRSLSDIVTRRSCAAFLGPGWNHSGSRAPPRRNS